MGQDSVHVEACANDDSTAAADSDTSRPHRNGMIGFIIGARLTASVDVNELIRIDEHAAEGEEGLFGDKMGGGGEFFVGGGSFETESEGTTDGGGA